MLQSHVTTAVSGNRLHLESIPSGKCGSALNYDVVMTHAFRDHHFGALLPPEPDRPLMTIRI